MSPIVFFGANSRFLPDASFVDGGAYGKNGVGELPLEMILTKTLLDCLREMVANAVSQRREGKSVTADEVVIHVSVSHPWSKNTEPITIYIFPRDIEGDDLSRMLWRSGIKDAFHEQLNRFFKQHHEFALVEPRIEMDVLPISGSGAVISDCGKIVATWGD
jgi:hypothetical protein